MIIVVCKNTDTKPFRTRYLHFTKWKLRIVAVVMECKITKKEITISAQKDRFIRTINESMHLE